MRLGAWPGDPYYDPQRPGWFPYWLDTPSESAVKWGLYPSSTLKEPGALKPAPAPSAPSNEQLKTWNPTDQAGSDRAAWKLWAEDPFPAAAPAEWDPWLIAALVAGGVSLALLWRQK